jgi:hypothetical protein
MPVATNPLVLVLRYASSLTAVAHEVGMTATASSVVTGLTLDAIARPAGGTSASRPCSGSENCSWPSSTSFQPRPNSRLEGTR